MIGEARTVTGSVTAIKSNGTRVSLTPGTPVDQGDVIETGPGASVGLVFVDKTVFSLGANARMTLDDMVFNPGSAGSSAFSVLTGAFSFVSGEIARTPEAMRVRTPVATIGIRGTQVAGNDQLIVLMSQDGHVGSVILNGQIILDQENQALLAGSGVPTFLSPDQIQNLFGTVLRILPLIRGALDNLDTNVAQLTDIEPASGGAGFGGGGSGLQFQLFDRGPLGLGLVITGPIDLNLILNLITNPPDNLVFTPVFIPEGSAENLPPIATDDGSGAVVEAGGVSPGQPTATGTLTDNVSDPDSGNPLSFSIGSGDGAFGTLELDAGGAWTYTLNNTDAETQELNGGETATETFTYTVADGDGGTASATITVTVTGTNDDPTANAESGAAIEAGDAVPAAVASGQLSDNVSDVDNGGSLGDDLDFAVSGEGTYGTLSLDTESGAWTYALNNDDPDVDALNAGETATETFTYTVNDQAGATATASLTVTVVGTNDAPTATNEIAGFVTEAGSGDSGGDGSGQFSAFVPSGDATIGGSLADNVSDVDNGGALQDDLDFEVDGEGKYGTLALNTETGEWTYTLNDQDPDTDSLAEGETATEIFTYTVNDAAGATATATLTVSIVGANDEPTANEAGGSVTEDADPNTATGSLSDNASDVDTGDDLDFSVNGTDGTYGALELNAETGQWTYSLNNDDAETDALADGATATETFTYTVDDGHGGTASATLTVTVVGTNDDPTANGAGGTVTEDSEPNTATGSLADNVSDVDSDNLDFAVGGTDGTYGTLELNAETGQWTYSLNNEDPETDALADGTTATETFIYTVSDGNGGTATASLTVTITGANDDPTANEAGGSVTEDADPNTATGSLSDNASDVDTGDDLDFTVNGTDGTYGTLELNAETGQWTYSLNNDDAETDALADGATATETFTYTVDDGHGGTASATLTVTVVGTNDDPTANGAGGTVTEDSENGTATGSLADNVSDVDGDNLDFAVGGTDGTYGTLELNAETGQWTYSLNNDDAETDALADGATATETFIYTVSDSNGGSATASLTVTITGANDDPTANEAGGSVTEDADPNTATGSLSDNAGDVDTGDDLDFTVNGTDGTYGTLELNAETGQWTYSLNNTDSQTDALAEGVTATDSFEYTVEDDHGGTAASTLTVTITGANDDPTATNETGGPVTEDGPGTVTGTLSDNVSDVDTGDDLDFKVDTTEGVYGTLSLDSDTGAWTYTLNNADPDTSALGAGQTASDTFVYTVDDGHGGTATASLTVAVLGTVEAPGITAPEDMSVPDAALWNLPPITVTNGESGDMQVSLKVSNGALSLGTATGLTFTDSDGSDGTLVFKGSVTDVNKALDSLRYQSKVVDVNTPDALVIDTKNLTTNQTATDTVDITIHADPNDADTFSGQNLSVDNDTLAGIDQEPLDPVLTGTVTIGTSGNDKLVGTAGDNKGAGSLSGGSGNDTISAMAGNDSVDGGSGHDSIFGGSGDDTLRGGDDNDTAYGGSGNDRLDGGDENDALFGGSGTDNLTGDDGDDSLFGGSGNDTLKADDGDDLVYGGAGDDSIDAGEDDDTVFGGSGSDTIDGDEGADTVYGGSGNDSVKGDDANDSIFGGSGADTLEGNSGADTLYGGEGNDILRGFDSKGGEGSGDLDVLFGGAGDDTLRGGGDNDSLYGGSGNDSVIGDNGDDRLYGGSGNDNLSGGNHNDLVIGGAGLDTMTGGNGDDTFAFLSPLDLGDATHAGDLITDFTNGDKLLFDLDGPDLANFEAPGFDGISGAGKSDAAPATLSLNELVTVTDGAGASVAGDVRFIFDQQTVDGEAASGSALYYDPTGGDGSDRVMVAQFTNGATITATDILVFQTNTTTTEHG